MNRTVSSEWRNGFASTAVPMWAVGAIVVVVLALAGCFAFCVFKKCFGEKKKSKKARERKGGGRRRKKGDQGEGDGEQKVQQ